MEELIVELKRYFKIEELVGRNVYNAFGDLSWTFFDVDVLTCLLVIRVGLDSPITINNWHLKGGVFEQRGLRDNTQPIVQKKTSNGRLYLSGHVLGKAFDFDVKGMSAVEVRKWISANEEKFPCKIRLERMQNGSPISWVHLDTKWFAKNPKVYLFDV